MMYPRLMLARNLLLLTELRNFLVLLKLPLAELYPVRTPMKYSRHSVLH